MIGHMPTSMEDVLIRCLASVLTTQYNMHFFLQLNIIYAILSGILSLSKEYRRGNIGGTYLIPIWVGFIARPRYKEWELNGILWIWMSIGVYKGIGKWGVKNEGLWEAYIGMGFWWQYNRQKVV